MTIPAHDHEQRKARGKKIYETKIKPLVEPQEKGKYVVIDVITGDYAIGRDWAYTTEELRNRRPDAVTYSVRVGHEAVVRMRSPRKILWNQLGDNGPLRAETGG